MSLKILVYFSPETLSNSYILCNVAGGTALIVDPHVFDIPLFETLEANGVTVGAVLLTHADEYAARAIRTMQSIYDFEIFGGSDNLENLAMNNIKSTNYFEAAGFTVKSLFLPGHYLDSLIFHIDDFLFTGDIITAGTMTDADGAYGRALLIQCIKESILDLPVHTLILPSAGPPSTVSIELETNSALKLSPEIST